MANHPAQAPQFNPNQGPNPWSRDAAALQYNQPQSPNHRRRNLLIGGGATVAALLTTGALIFGGDSKEGPRSETMTSQGTEGIDTLPDNPADMTTAQFEGLTRVEQMDYAGTILNASMDEDLQAEKEVLERLGWGDYNYLEGRDFVQPSLDNTPQQIWDQITLGYRHVYELARDGDMQEAQKIALGVAEGKELNDLLDTLQDGGGEYSVIGVGHSRGAKPVIKKGEYQGVHANGLGLIEFSKESMMGSNSVVRVVARFTQGNDPDSGRWVLVKTVKQ